MTATRVADASAARASGPAYAAFISYSRNADGRLAPRLENALERFATPWYRLRAFRVFRDDASLSTNPGLWSSLTDALDRVGYFVLLASPAAAESVWVGREVEYWLEHRERERLLIVLTAGEIVWDESIGDFDWQRTTALPRTISGAYTEEPRYTDLRFAAQTDQLSVRDPRFRAAVADVAAPLHGIAKDDLIGEEVRQHKRTMRIARAAGVSLALLTAAASVAAVLAVRSADRASRERDRAEREARVATSRQLAAQSTVALQGDQIDGALDRAARAWRTAKTSEARDAVLAALKGAGGVEGFVQGPRPDYSAISGDRRKVALLGPVRGANVFAVGDRVSVLDLGAERTAGTPLTISRPAHVAGLALDAHGARLAVGYDGGSVDVWDLAARTMHPIERPAHTPPYAASPVFSADGTRLAWAGPGDRILVWDGRHVQRLRLPDPPGDVPAHVALSGDGRYLAAVGTIHSKLVLWHLGSGRPPRVLPGGGPRFSAVSRGEHGAIALGAGRRPVLAVGGADDGRVELRDAASGRMIRAVKLHRGPIDSLAFSPQGRVVAAVDLRAVTVLSRTGARLGAVSAVGAEAGAAPLDDGGRVATIGRSGTVVIRTAVAAMTTQIARSLEGADHQTNLAFDPSGRAIVAQDAQLRVRLWDAARGRPVGPPVTGPIDLSTLGFASDGRVLTCCGVNGYDRVRLWDRDGAGLRGPQPAVARGDTVSVGATADGRLVIGRTVGERFTISGAARPLSFRTADSEGEVTADGRWAVIPTDDGADLWDLGRGRRTASLPDVDLTLSPTGALVAAADAPVELFDRFTGRKRGVLGDADMNVTAMAFSPDGRTLAVLNGTTGTAGGTRTTLELWDVAARRRVGGEPLYEIDDDLVIPDLVYSPDGRRLVLGTGDSPPLVFDLDADAWAARACEVSPACRGGPSNRVG